MIFLAPWALVVGGMAAAGAVLLHLVARQRPAVYVLPTTRFVPDRRTLVSRVATRPRDLLLLALRLLLLVSASLAFARPVLAPTRVARARLVLLDRSSDAGKTADVVSRVRALLRDGVPTRLVAFDSAAAPAVDASAALDSIARDTSQQVLAGSITNALVAARRTAPALGALADSVELVLVSPLEGGQLDAATDSVRARWPGRISIVRLPTLADTSRTWTLEHALGPDDPLAPALARVRAAATPHAVRLRHDAASSSDSAFARAGGTVVVWDTTASATPGPQALALSDDVVVATMRRGEPRAGGRIIARWSDGAAAATEARVGAGCIRSLAVGIPVAGDLPLRTDFQRVVRGLMAPCGGASSSVPADSAQVTRLSGAGGAAAGTAFIGHQQGSSTLAPWLLALALACALAELALRARAGPEHA